jgi:hypothetical protein
VPEFDHLRGQMRHELRGGQAAKKFNPAPKIGARLNVREQV